ncbi:hypothetical protein PR048_031150 [Dryococelus australis]|uniref:Uncharacterized protein n=1 Tax=Dryococelus australis TaxID=614101 RepID=A0ABQ9G4F9_9NEOP|nr:hypothetical protein PR048_031150 [Dryococelus australis]
MAGWFLELEGSPATAAKHAAAATGLLRCGHVCARMHSPFCKHHGPPPTSIPRAENIACHVELLSIIHLDFTVPYLLEPASFLHWLPTRCEVTPFVTALHVIGAHNCEVFIYWQDYLGPLTFHVIEDNMLPLLERSILTSSPHLASEPLLFAMNDELLQYDTHCPMLRCSSRMEEGYRTTLLIFRLTSTFAIGRFPYNAKVSATESQIYTIGTIRRASKPGEASLSVHANLSLARMLRHLHPVHVSAPRGTFSTPLSLSSALYGAVAPWRCAHRRLLHCRRFLDVDSSVLGSALPAFPSGTSRAQIYKFWVDLNIEVLRVEGVKRGDYGAALECKGGWKWDIPEKTRRTAGSHLRKSCSNPDDNRLKTTFAIPSTDGEIRSPWKSRRRRCHRRSTRGDNDGRAQGWRWHQHASITLHHSHSCVYWSLRCLFIGCCRTEYPVLPHAWQYGVRYMFPCRSAIDRTPALANSVRFPGGVTPGFPQVGTIPDDTASRRVFSGTSRLPSPLHSGAAPCSPRFPSSALRTSTLRAAQISSLHSTALVMFPPSATTYMNQLRPRPVRRFANHLLTDEVIGRDLKNSRINFGTSWNSKRERLTQLQPLVHAGLTRFEFRSPPAGRRCPSAADAAAEVFEAVTIVPGSRDQDGNTARLARRSDEALGVRVTVVRIASSLLDLGRAGGGVVAAVRGEWWGYWRRGLVWEGWGLERAEVGRGVWELYGWRVSAISVPMSKTLPSRLSAEHQQHMLAEQINGQQCFETPFSNHCLLSHSLSCAQANKEPSTDTRPFTRASCIQSEKKHAHINGTATPGRLFALSYRLFAAAHLPPSVPGSIPCRVTPGFAQVGIMAGRRLWLPGFLGDLFFPPPLNRALHHSHQISPSLALKIPLLGAAQISQLNSTQLGELRVKVSEYLSTSSCSLWKRWAPSTARDFSRRCDPKARHGRRGGGKGEGPWEIYGAGGDGGSPARCRYKVHRSTSGERQCEAERLRRQYQDQQAAALLAAGAGASESERLGVRHGACARRRPPTVYNKEERARTAPYAKSRWREGSLRGRCFFCWDSVSAAGLRTTLYKGGFRVRWVPRRSLMRDRNTLNSSCVAASCTQRVQLWPITSIPGNSSSATVLTTPLAGEGIERIERNLVIEVTGNNFFIPLHSQLPSVSTPLQSPLFACKHKLFTLKPERTDRAVVTHKPAFEEHSPPGMSRGRSTARPRLPGDLATPPSIILLAFVRYTLRSSAPKELLAEETSLRLLYKPSSRALRWSGATGGVAVRLLASHLVEPGSITNGVTQRFSHVGVVLEDAAGRRVFLRASTIFPTLQSDAAPYSSHFTLIGSQDLDVAYLDQSREQVWRVEVCPLPRPAYTTRQAPSSCGQPAGAHRTRTYTYEKPGRVQRNRPTRGPVLADGRIELMATLLEVGHRIDGRMMDGWTRRVVANPV